MATAAESDPSDIESLEARQRDVLYGQPLSVIAFNLLLGAILAAALWNDVAAGLLLSWLLALSVVVAARAGLVLVYRRGRRQTLSPALWINLYAAGAFLTGAVWGLCLPYFGPFPSVLSLGIAALWPCGICAGVLVSYAFVKRVLFAFVVPALVPGIIYLARLAPAEIAIFGAGIAAYLAFLSIAAVYLNRSQLEAFEFERENLRLNQDLKRKNEAITRLNNDLEGRLRAKTSELEDTTSALKGEVRKRESNERRLQLMIERTPSAIAMLDRELRYVAVSDRWLKDFGLAGQDIIGRSHYDVFPEVPDRWRQVLDRAMAGATERSEADRFDRADGEQHWLNWEVCPWYDDGGRIGGVVIFAEVITERKRAEAQVQRLQWFDELTGLPNQASLQAELTRLCAAEPPRPFCLMLFEIRRFSAINGALGYAGADRVLKEIAQRTRQHAGGSGFVARLGASVFGVVWPRMSDPHQAQARLLNQKSRITEPMEMDGARFEPQITAGLVLHPQHGETPELLLRNATAARQAARGRRDGVAVYAPEQDISVSSLGELADLRRALVERQFTLAYQPKVDLRTGQLCGAEALIRWQHPERGFIPPDRFIPLAEQSGLITAITEWVIDTALQECARWHEAGVHLGVSVNVSARDLQEEGFLHGIRQALGTKLVPPESVTLEITESAVMDDPQASLESLFRIRDAGARLALDDYGTGYSSLGYLSRMPVQELKIDKSFVLDLLKASVIVRSTIALGHELGLEVTAEGVETAELQSELIRMGCDIGQGYGISKPLPRDKFLEFCHQYDKSP